MTLSDLWGGGISPSLEAVTGDLSFSLLYFTAFSILRIFPCNFFYSVLSTSASGPPGATASASPGVLRPRDARLS